MEPYASALIAEIRKYCLTERKNARAAECDSIRIGLGEIKARLHQLESLTEKDVHGLCSRIKRRKHATKEDMYRLSHSFLQSNDNINVFSNTTGALYIIVKELTGKNAEHQVFSAECLCNLSLGEAHVCEKISNAAGSYLITYLDCSEPRLKRTSFWILANILATSTKATETLLRMGLIRKLWANYVTINEDYCEDAGKCLVLVSRKSKHVLKEDDLNFILKNINAKNPTGAGSEYHLEIIFNLGLVNPEHLLSDANALYLINYALSQLGNCTEMKSEKDCSRIIFAVRVLVNVLSTHSTYDIFLKQLGTVWQSNLSAVFNKLFTFSEGSLLNEILWFLKTVIDLQVQSSGLDVDNFLKNLLVPKGSVQMFEPNFR